MPGIDYSILGTRNILLVEDVVMNQDLACRILHGWGMKVDVASNGREAVDKVLSHSYDLILMDIQMPDMDGVEATIAIRNIPDTSKSRLPIIALTANVLKSDKERYFLSGINDILAKPYTEGGLFQVIAQNLGVLPKENSLVRTNDNTRTSAAPLYDLTMVRSVSGGDESFVLKMVDLFLSTIPQALTEIRKQCNQKDWEALGKSAHKLKSTIDSLGIVSLKQDIRLLEGYGRNKENISGIPELVDKIVGGMESCMELVKKDFGR